MWQWTRGTRGRALVASGAALALAAVCSASTTAGAAEPTIQTGTVEPLYESPDAGARDRWMQRTTDVGAGFVRINVFWPSVVERKPQAPSDPDDPAYDWSRIDGAVQSADEHQLHVIFTVYGAPSWAHAPNVPAGVRPEAWKPSPRAFGRFARAMAKRYSVGAQPTRWYEIWNEPNLTAYLAPQWIGKRPASPSMYSHLLNAAYSNIKAVSSSAQVISAGTAPYGEDPGGTRMHPVTFLRSLFCVQGGQGCRTWPHMDVIAAHPIDRRHAPGHSAPDPLDVATPNLGRIQSVVAAAQRVRHVVGPPHIPLWVTEFWWETDPPDKVSGVPPLQQAKYIENALFSFWLQHVPVAINLQMRDSKSSAGDPFASYQTGIYYFSGKRKPSYNAFRFPFVARPLGARTLVWGRSPATGPVSIEERSKGVWTVLDTVAGRAGMVFTKRVAARSGNLLRAVAGGIRSLPWRVR